MQIQVQLDSQQAMQLRRYCRRTGESVASAIQQALDDWLPIVAATRVETLDRAVSELEDAVQRAEGGKI